MSRLHSAIISANIILTFRNENNILILNAVYILCTKDKLSLPLSILVNPKH